VIAFDYWGNELVISVKDLPSAFRPFGEPALSLLGDSVQEELFSCGGIDSDIGTGNGEQHILFGQSFAQFQNNALHPAQLCWGELLFFGDIDKIDQHYFAHFR